VRGDSTAMLWPRGDCFAALAMTAARNDSAKSLIFNENYKLATTAYKNIKYFILNSYKSC
jgi:hypothetical protein